MDTAYKPPDYHKRRKQTAQGINGISNSCVLNQAVELHHSSGQYAHGEHGCRRWVRCFQNAVYQNGAVIDYVELKKYICTEDKEIKHTKSQDAAVNFPNVFSFDPLRQSQDCKAQRYEDRHDTCPIGDIVKGHVDSKQIMDSLVDACVCNGRTVRANRLYINKRQ